MTGPTTTRPAEGTRWIRNRDNTRWKVNPPRGESDRFVELVPDGKRSNGQCAICWVDFILLHLRYRQVKP